MSIGIHPLLVISNLLLLDAFEFLIQKRDKEPNILIINLVYSLYKHGFSVDHALYADDSISSASLDYMRLCQDVLHYAVVFGVK